jgi:hypothetical protein
MMARELHINADSILDTSVLHGLGPDGLIQWQSLQLFMRLSVVHVQKASLPSQQLVIWWAHTTEQWSYLIWFFSFHTGLMVQSICVHLTSVDDGKMQLVFLFSLWVLCHCTWQSQCLISKSASSFGTSRCWKRFSC